MEARSVRNQLKLPEPSWPKVKRATPPCENPSPNAKVSDGSQPPMTFVFQSGQIGWLPFAGPSGSVISCILSSKSSSAAFKLESACN